MTYQSMTPMPPPPPPPGYGVPMIVPASPRQFGLFSAIALAPFFSGALYRDVARNWRGIAFGVLFVTLVVTWAISLAHAHVEIKKFGRDELPTIVQDVPPVTIKDGVVSSPVDQPYEIKDKQRGQTFAILDTTGQINSLDNTSAQLLLTKDKLFLRDGSGNSVREYPLKGVKSFYIDRASVQGWFDRWAPRFAPLAFVPAIVASLIYRLIELLIYALIGMVFASAFGATLSYGALFRLATLSIVPVLILQTIVDFLPLPFGIWGIAWLAIAMVYLAMAVRANAADNIMTGGFQPMPYPPPPPGATPPTYR